MATLSPHRLTRVILRDFRGIDELELELPDDDDDRGGALVLAGENGCGKTSVLEAILLLFGRVDLMPTDTAPPSDLVRQGAKDFRLEARCAGTDPAWFVSAYKLSRLDTSLRDLGREGLTFGAAIPGGVHEKAMRVIQWGAPPVSEFTIEYFSARREPEDLGAAVSDARGRRSMREERRLAELVRRLANVYARSRRNQTFERIERYMRAFLGAQWSLDVVFRDASEGSDPVVVVRDAELPPGPDGEPLTFHAVRERAQNGEAMPKVIPIDRLSSGQMAVLSMAHPFVFGERPVDLALLDEPEQHLHPVWQRSLLPALRELSPSTRFIVATHSPHVLDSVAPYERFALEPLRVPAPLHDAAE